MRDEARYSHVQGSWANNVVPVNGIGPLTAGPPRTTEFIARFPLVLGLPQTIITGLLDVLG